MIETRPTLLQRVAGGTDQKSWSEFVALYEPLLRAFARKKGMRPHDGEDVVQVIFVSLLRKLPAYDRSRGRFRTWLWQIARNAVVDYWRKEKSLATAEDQKKAMPVEGPDEEDEWNREHRRRILEFAMEQVREQTLAKSWACFEEHILRARRGIEVGKELGLPANSVYVNANRVMQRIRERCALWRDELEEDDRDLSPR